VPKSVRCWLKPTRLGVAGPRRVAKPDSAVAACDRCAWKGDEVACAACLEDRYLRPSIATAAGLSACPKGALSAFASKDIFPAERAVCCNGNAMSRYKAGGRLVQVERPSSCGAGSEVGRDAWEDRKRARRGTERGAKGTRSSDEVMKSGEANQQRGSGRGRGRERGGREVDVEEEEWEQASGARTE